MTPKQFKDWSKNKAKETNTPIPIIQRDYILDEVLRKISHSEYKNDLVLKGGFYVQSLMGTTSRTTEDLDATLIHKKNSEAEIMNFIKTTLSKNTEEGIKFSDFKIDGTREAAHYPGFRIRAGAYIGKTRIPFKMDITTGDAIVPSPIVHAHKLMFENQSLKVLAYPVEQVVAEKLQTVLSRAESNTRSKDLYDLYLIQEKIPLNYDDVRLAFQATSKKRQTLFSEKSIQEKFKAIETSPKLKEYWKNYISKPENSYAKKISYEKIISGTKNVITKMAASHQVKDPEIEIPKKLQKGIGINMDNHRSL